MKSVLSCLLFLALASAATSQPPPCPCPPVEVCPFDPCAAPLPTCPVAVLFVNGPNATQRVGPGVKAIVKVNNTVINKGASTDEMGNIYVPYQNAKDVVTVVLYFQPIGSLPGVYFGYNSREVGVNPNDHPIVVGAELNP